MKMLKKSLIAIAVLAVAMPAFAGQIKVHNDWPQICILEKQKVWEFNVTMDVGYWIKFESQSGIKVDQYGTTDPYHTYHGCKTFKVKSNFLAQLIFEATATSPANGTWTATAVPNPVPASASGTNVEICVDGTGVAIENLTGGGDGVVVAKVVVYVLPGA